MASTSFPKLNRAPIIEALLDIWVAFPAPVEPEKLTELHEHFKPDFSEIAPIPLAQVQITGDGRPSASTDDIYQRARACFQDSR